MAGQDWSGQEASGTVRRGPVLPGGARQAGLGWDWLGQAASGMARQLRNGSLWWG